MSAILQINPFEQIFDANGDPLDAGYIYVGVANLDPETNPIAVFYDSALTLPAAQPIRTVNGYVLSAGSPTALYVNSNYSIKVKNKNLVQIYYIPDFYAGSSAISVLNRLPVPSVSVLRNTRPDIPFVVLQSYILGANIGGGLLNWDAANVTADNGITVFAVTGISTGRWVRPIDEVITPYHAGAVDYTDSIDALDRFAAFVKADAGKSKINVIGNFKISRPFNFIFQGQIAFDWNLNLSATVAMRYVIALQGKSCKTTGTLKVNGLGSVNNYNTLTVEYGVVLNGIQSSVLPAIEVNLFKYFGIVSDEGGGIGIPLVAPATYHNNTMLEMGKIKSLDCGCSQVAPWKNDSTVVSFSNPVHSGASGAATQRTTVDVTSLPYDENLRGTPVLAVINNITYKVLNTDFVNNKVDLFPWMEAAEPVSGTISFFFGGAYHSIGSNTGPTKIGLIDAIRTAIGVQDIALYGVNVTSITTQYCATGAVIGQAMDLVGPQSSCYIGFYTEAVYRNMIHIGVGSATILNRYGTFAGEPFVNCEKISPNNRLNDYGAFADSVVMRNIFMPAGAGNQLNGAYFKGRAQNKDITRADVALATTDIVPRIYKRDAWTIALRDNTLANNMKGLDDMIIGFVGTGTNGAPTGAFTFNPPSGWTVNGGSSAVFSGFSGAAVFVCYWQYTTSNIVISSITQKAVTQAASTAATVADVVTDFNALLTKLKNAGLMA